MAAALMTRMRIDEKERPVVKLACVRMMLRLPLNGAQRALVQQFLDFYLQLRKPERVTFEREAAKLPLPEKEKVMTVINEWAEEALKKGRREGMQKGREEALSPFLRLLRKAVGELPADVERRLRKLPRARLDKLADALPSMKSLAELKAWLARRSSR